MKKITLILCLLTLVVNAQAQQQPDMPTELVKDLDGDNIADTVRFDFHKSCIVCKLSSKDFEPIVSISFTLGTSYGDFVTIDIATGVANGFVFTDIRDNKYFFNTFIYNTQDEDMRLVKIEMFTPKKIKEVGMGMATLELISGEFTASWTYDDPEIGDKYVSLGEIKEEMGALPITDLSSFSEDMEYDYVEMCLDRYRRYRERALAGDFSYDQTKKVRTDLDGDQVLDSVYLDGGRGAVICKLSSKHFAPMQSGMFEAMRGKGLRDFYVFELDDGLHVQQRTHDGGQENVAIFHYEPQSQHMRLTEMFRGCGMMEGGERNDMDRNGYSKINMLTGEYTGEWSYYVSTNETHSIPTIKEIAVLPSGKYLSAIYLEDFRQGTFETYNEICDNLFNTYKEQEQVRSHEVRDPRKAQVKEIEIPILNGSVVIQSEEGEELPCVYVKIVDKRMSSDRSGTFFELRKRGEKYYAWEDKSCPTLSKAIVANLEVYFKEVYTNREERKRVWDAFVSEGGLQKYIDFINEFVDDDFLAAPFGDIYG